MQCLKIDGGPAIMVTFLCTPSEASAALGSTRNQCSRQWKLATIIHGCKEAAVYQAFFSK